MEKPPKIELPPKYYLDYFNYVQHFVQDKYSSILQENEFHFLRKYYCLSEDSQCLFIRFCNRRGSFFRVNRLIYSELSDIPSSLNELIERNFIEHISSSKHKEWIRELLDIFKKEELLKFCKTTIKKSLKKDEVLQLILENENLEDIIEAIQNFEPIIKVCFEHEVAFIKFLFFGNRYMDMTEFVLRDIGIMQYENHDDDKLVTRFSTRKEAEEKWFITDQNDTFNQLKDTSTPLEIFDWFLNVNDSLTDLTEIARVSYDKLVLKIGQYLEKNKQYDEALTIFRLTEAVPSRERQVRTLEKLKFNEEAIALCDRMLEISHNADEFFFATDFKNRVNSKTQFSKKSTTSMLHKSESITISAEHRRGVEMGVVAYYFEQGKQAYFSENYLWRAIFGLTFWDIIFDPSLVAFHHPFQRRPADLYLPDFYQKRKEMIESHLQSFEDIQQFLVYIGQKYEEKFGIANPFVLWLDDAGRFPIWLLVRKAVELIDFDAIKVVLLEISKNLTENARGFPDLFMFDDEGNYSFVEVKSPTDNLSNQQLFWLQFFERVGVKAKVLRVFWEVEIVHI
jgi:tetratricopeptide (TPR) repeat protein